VALTEGTGLTMDWQVKELRASVAAVLPSLAIEVVARIESTNSALVDRMRTVGTQGQARRSVDSQPCLLVAEHQTRGRGRLGRAWLSSPGTSLTFSLALPMAPVDWSGLSLAVGVGLAEALEPLTDGAMPRVCLKWPNDLWLVDPAAPMGGRKLGGILIETVPAQGRRMCVVGVGLNILPQPLGQFSSGYASLSELHPGMMAAQALHRLAAPLVRALQTFEASGFPAFVERFAARDILAGRWVTTTMAETPEGRAEGVDDRGALRLICADGRRVAVNSGEVSIRPAADAEPQP
jgi:BirA family transcriptional regulator, biotin operon repressor / biotin---[acetyl-CoA-carboxylase] ligase